MGVGDVAYESAATYGRIHSLIGAIVATVIALLFMAIGLYLLIKEPTIHYTSEDDGSSPQPKVMSKTGEIWLGIGLIVGGLLIGGLSWLMTYFTMKSKSFAAVSGTVDVASDIMSVFRH